MAETVRQIAPERRFDAGLTMLIKTALAEKSLVWFDRLVFAFVTAVTAGLWVYAAIQPHPWRLVAATGMSLLLWVPGLWSTRRSPTPE